MGIEIKHMQDGLKGIFIARSKDNDIGELAYHTEGTEVMSINHTEVKASEQGNDVGLQLLDFAADYARENKLRIRPVCKFVNVMFRKHPEKYKDVI